MKNYINKSSVKAFILPFNGFYQSHIDYDLDAELESNLEWIAECDEDKGKQLEQWLNNTDLTYAYKSFYNVVSSQLVEFMTDSLNEEYNTSIKFYNVDYMPMNMQNMGDNLGSL